MFQRVLPQGVKAAEPFPMSTNAALQSPECLYRKFDGLDLSAFADELSPYMPLKCDVMPQTPLMKERYASHFPPVACDCQPADRTCPHLQLRMPSGDAAPWPITHHTRCLRG